MKFFTSLLFSTLASFILSCDSGGNKTTSTLEARIDSVFADFNSNDTPGAAVAVVQDGKIAFKKGYGSANLEYGIPVTPSTVFHIASVSKQFTTFSVLLLAEEGKLNFDDDVRKYIPEVPDFGETITLRHLASHTSGLRDQWNLLVLAGWRMDDVITREQILKLISRQKELNFKPGDEFLYCNTGYTLLAEVVSRVSGMPFSEFTQVRIFQPLGMTNTQFYDDHEKIVKNRAYSYYEDENGFKKSVLSYANVGATSLFTTVEDLSLWALNFESPQVGNEEIINQLNTLATLNNGETFGGAYGQFIDTYRGLNQIQHGGADAGYRTYLGRFPDQRFAVSVFSNRADAGPGNLAMQVVDLFLEEEMSDESDEIINQEAFIELSSGDMEPFLGSYWSDSEFISREILFENDTLRYSRGPDNQSLLVPIDRNIFKMLNVGVDLKVSFETDKEPKQMVVTIDDDEPIIFESYEPKSFTQKELNELSGTYYSEELRTSYELLVKNDTLVAVHPRHDDMKITPVRKDILIGENWYFDRIQIERDPSEIVSGMRVSNGRVRNLYFEKLDNSE